MYILLGFFVGICYFGVVGVFYLYNFNIYLGFSRKVGLDDIGNVGIYWD